LARRAPTNPDGAALRRRCSKSRGQIGQPRRRRLDQQSLEALVETGEDQRTEDEQQPTHQRLAAAPGGEQAVAPSHERLARPPEKLKARYKIDGKDDVLKTMAGVLEAFTTAAAN
jgi:hypothetical protein